MYLYTTMYIRIFIPAFLCLKKYFKEIHIGKIIMPKSIPYYGSFYLWVMILHASYTTSYSSLQPWASTFFSQHKKISIMVVSHIQFTFQYNLYIVSRENEKKNHNKTQFFHFGKQYKTQKSRLWEYRMKTSHEHITCEICVDIY